MSSPSSRRGPAAAHADPALRVVVFSGAGKVFSAGADAAWMAKMVGYSHEDNVRDATAGAEMFLALNTVPAIVIGRIHGAALGGGSGLAAVCDIVVAESAAVFGFTETKLGILPAMISPYVLQKIGVSAARELFLTGIALRRRAREGDRPGPRGRARRPSSTPTVTQYVTRGAQRLAHGGRARQGADSARRRPRARPT